ncbi:MAG: DsbA family protein, partial [Nitrosopumilus sp.]|nr:DsbA family protein [Nitrosopumilus sp.]
MSSEDVEVNPKNNEKMVSKAVFNKLIIITIITIGVAAFFAGTYTSNLNSDQVSEKEL